MPTKYAPSGVDLNLASDCVDLLNEILAADPDLAARLLFNRFDCNDAIANHATIQVGMYDEQGHFDPNGTPKVNILGIMNGLCGAFANGPRKGWGAIAAILSEEDSEGKRTLLEFAMLENVKDDVTK